MTKDEALKLAIEVMNNYNDGWTPDEMVSAINACKEALEQPAQELVEIMDLMQYGQSFTKVVAEPAQEPVAWYGKDTAFPNNNKIFVFNNKDDANAYGMRKSVPINPLYTHPHQWQGLTDNEKLASIRKWAENNTMRGQELIGLCDAIEQALKEKNHD